MEKLALVALGGALGAVLRYLTVTATMRLVTSGFPWGTMLVNVLGSFLMGILAVLLVERMPGEWTRAGPLLMTGLLGGFTTFSAFSLDVISLIERERVFAAAGYAAGSVALSVGALVAGMALARASA